MVTSDGLPYKEMIKILQNNCVNSDVNFDRPSEITKHLKERHYDEYFQTYGSVLHYCQAALRALIRVMWDIELEDLAKSIGLESPKALFSFQNGAKFRQSFDLIHRAQLKVLMRFLDVVYVV